MKRSVLATAGAGAVVVVGLAFANAAQSKPNPGPDEIRISATPQQVQVVGLPCLPGALTVGMTNTGSAARYADMEMTARRPVILDRRVFSSWLPVAEPDRTVSVKVGVTVPRDAKPGKYTVDLNVDRSRLTVPVEVLPLPPKGDGDNLAVGEQAAASSTHGSFQLCGAVDGDANSDNWSTSTGWNDGTRAVFPDNYSVTLPNATSISRIVTGTLDSAKYPAASYGLRDFDVQVRTGGAWVTVHQVRGNVAGKVTSTFPATTADAVQIVALDSNDHAYSRIVELGVYSS
jgi:hypothetical protein